jgi:putative (di)nucleoside polyphosphate hydrolase
MPHVMLVEPDDDFCLSLRQAISSAGCRMTIVGSVAEATAALAGPDRVDQVITEAFLPDGSGLVLAQDVRQMGKPALVLRRRRGRIVVNDRDGTVFRGGEIEVGAFLASTLLENRRIAPKSIESPSAAGWWEASAMSAAQSGQATASNAGYRPCVGIMLLNRRGEVLVARRSDVSGEAWQMPQGGIDKGEEPRAAAIRELKEEIGTDRAEILAESKNWLCYDLPAELIERARHLGWRGQRQRWFVMRFTGADRDINLAAEHAEFSAWKWVPARDLPKLIVSFKRQVYVELLAEFPALIRGHYHTLAELMAEIGSITGGAIEKLP